MVLGKRWFTHEVGETRNLPSVNTTLSVGKFSNDTNAGTCVPSSRLYLKCHTIMYFVHFTGAVGGQVFLRARHKWIMNFVSLVEAVSSLEPAWGTNHTLWDSYIFICLHLLCVHEGRGRATKGMERAICLLQGENMLQQTRWRRRQVARIYTSLCLQHFKTSYFHGE